MAWSAGREPRQWWYDYGIGVWFCCGSGIPALKAFRHEIDGCVLLSRDSFMRFDHFWGTGLEEGILISAQVFFLLVNFGPFAHFDLANNKIAKRRLVLLSTQFSNSAFVSHQILATTLSEEVHFSSYQYGMGRRALRRKPPSQKATLLELLFSFKIQLFRLAIHNCQK